MEDEIGVWKFFPATIGSFLAMMGFNYRWIQTATKRDCVIKPDCKEDRNASWRI